MKVFRTTLSALCCIALLSCGGKQSTDTAQKPEADAGAAAEGKSTAENPAVDDTKKRIRAWLSSDIALKVQESAKKAGKTVGTKLAANQAVMKGVKDLTGAILKDKTVKPKLDKIEDKATAGFSKKLTLGWKALRAGGIDEFKAKVGADAQRVGTEVLGAHVKNVLMKDARMSALLKDFSKVMKLQGQVAAVVLQENLSSKVNSMILSLALRFAAAGGSEAAAERVDTWISACEDDAASRIDAMIDDVANLQSVNDALQSLAVEVLTHERTKKELIQMFNKLLDTPEVNAGLIAVYEAAAFEKGDDTIRQAMEKVVTLEVVDNELFETLNRLAAAEGAGEIIGRNLSKAADDPRLAALVEDFIISILETCGDPARN